MDYSKEHRNQMRNRIQFCKWRTDSSQLEYVFKLYINRRVSFKWYYQVPGRNSEEKRTYCLKNGCGLVFHHEHKFFICYGHKGVPVAIAGLEKVEVFDEYGNQITIQ